MKRTQIRSAPGPRVASKAPRFNPLKALRVVCETELPTASKMLLVALISHSDPDGSSFPSHRKLCKETGIKSPNRLRDRLRALIHAGLVNREPRLVDGRRTSNSYTLHLDRASGVVPQNGPPPLSHGEVDPLSQKGVVNNYSVKTTHDNKLTPNVLTGECSALTSLANSQEKHGEQGEWKRNTEEMDKVSPHKVQGYAPSTHSDEETLDEVIERFSRPQLTYPGLATFYHTLRVRFFPLSNERLEREEDRRAIKKLLRLVNHPKHLLHIPPRTLLQIFGYVFEDWAAVSIGLAERDFIDDSRIISDVPTPSWVLENIEELEDMAEWDRRYRRLFGVLPYKLPDSERARIDQAYAVVNTYALSLEDRYGDICASFREGSISIEQAEREVADRDQSHELLERISREAEECFPGLINRVKSLREEWRKLH